MNDRYSNLDVSRIYVIGDIHGRLDLLDILIGKIDADLKSAPTPEPLTVTLGDYIDRGPNSRGVLERLAHNPFPMPYLPLKGNHEELLMTFLDDPSSFGQMASPWWTGDPPFLRSSGIVADGRDWL